MKRCKLLLGQMWNGSDIEQKVNIPDDVFFYNLKDVGHGTKVGCVHYGTVVRTADYADWIKYLKKKNLWQWDIDVIGEYTIITIRIVYFDKHNLPIKDREEVLKDFDFYKYVFVYYDKNYRCVNIRRIFKFKSYLDIEVGVITFRDYMSTNEMLSIETSNMELSRMQPYFGDLVYSKYKVFEGEEAEIIWNTAINKIISTNYNYDRTKVDTDYNFNPEYDEWLKMHNNKTVSEYLEEFI